jgi:hypothetical protein
VQSEPPAPPAPLAPPVPSTLDTTANHPELTSGSAEETNQSAPAPIATTSSIISSLPAMDTSLPPIDSSHSLDDNELPSFDAALRAVSSSAADLSLPAIDTTLPSLDSTLPAIGTDIPTMDHPFGDDSPFAHHDSHDGSEHALNVGHDGTHQGSINGSTHYQTPSNDNYQTSNGNYQYNQNSHHDGRQQSQASPQHQYQSQPPQGYQQQTDMYHNTGGGFASVNANSNNGQGQPGQMPQAPIGSPMPPMASMGQYMAGYPSNVSPSSSYSLPGDPNKMLSGGRHKKEVKRRTKTGCLTCRKRRIKVCWFLALRFCTLRFAGRRASLVAADPAIVYFIISRLTHDLNHPFFALLVFGQCTNLNSATKDIRSAEIV